MKQKGFSFTEVLVSLFLLLSALLFVGRMNMSSLHLIQKGKINQQATLLFLRKVDELRSVSIESLKAGEFEESSGVFSIQWRIQEDTPYFGTKQIQCRILYQPTASVILENILYRSE